MNDPVWKGRFSRTEFNEIKAEEGIFRFNKPFPSDLQEVIFKLNKNVNSNYDLYCA
jgi:hypothetical protein